MDTRHRFYLDDEPLPRTISEWLNHGSRHMDDRINIDTDSGALVRAMRTKRGMSRGEFEKACGIRQGRAAQIEDRTDIRFSTLVTIAKGCRYKIKFVPEEDYNA